MRALNKIDRLRKNIIQDKDILYFDYTASGQGYLPIEKKILKILKRYANTHSEVASSSIFTSNEYEKARVRIKKSLELNDEFALLPCGSGSTGAIKKFQELYGIYIPPATKKRYVLKMEKKPIVFVGPFEHHSNEVSFREGLCDVVRIPLKDSNSIDIEFLKRELEIHKDREIIGSFSVASNVTGIISPYKEIYTIIKSYGGIVCLDGATSSAYMNVDCNYYDVMFLSPHKLLGGVGSCGLLVIRKELCNISETPTFAGGGTVKYVSRVNQEYIEDIESREDAGTPAILQFIRASLSYKLRDKVGLEYIKQRERKLMHYFGKRIQEIRDIILYCKPSDDKLAIFSINVGYLDPYEISKELSDKFGIQTRAGCSCAGPYGHDLLNLEDNQVFEKKPGWLRISLHYTHTKSDIDKLLSAIKSIVSSKCDIISK
jgi:selenocysteine lyase/cysteine desulfurase